MGGNNSAVKTKCWEKFLESLGCEYKGDAASHSKYKCPNCFQPIIFRGKDKEIPGFHIHTNLKTLGIPKEEFYNWVKENC